MTTKSKPVATLVESVFALRRQLNRRLGTLLREEAGSTHTVRQLGLLWRVGNTSDWTQAEAAEAMNIDAPALSRLVDQLENEGLLKRSPGVDRRSRSLKVTAKGRAAVKPLEEVFAKADQELRTTLGARDAKALQRLLLKALGASRG